MTTETINTQDVGEGTIPGFGKVPPLNAAAPTKAKRKAARKAGKTNPKAAKASANGKAAKVKKTAPTKSKSKREGLSCLDACAKVLNGRKNPMNAKELIDAMAEKGLWTSPGGATPHATLASSLIREIAVKGKDSRFKKVAPGQFASTGK